MQPDHANRRCVARARAGLLASALAAARQAEQTTLEDEVRAKAAVTLRETAAAAAAVLSGRLREAEAASLRLGDRPQALRHLQASLRDDVAVVERSARRAMAAVLAELTEASD